MKIYLVGGAVRDQLLGLPVKEKDWVVVGATVNDMRERGFRQVGKDFPVFLHPKTNEEYALARKERKTGPGYTGFSFDVSPDVTLEEDLKRRDLTINAMAIAADGALIDPYHGKADLVKKILRHVSPAFVEDPVRILRIARFAARFGFQIAPETMGLMKKMVAAGEVDALVAERVWKELERALLEKQAEKFFEVLAECGALQILFPIGCLQAGINTLLQTTKQSNDSEIRFAVLMHCCSVNAINQFCMRYKVPSNHRELALLTAVQLQKYQQQKKISPNAILNFLLEVDAFRREERFKKLLLIFEVCVSSFSKDQLIDCYNIAKKVDVQDLVVKGYKGKEIAEQLNLKRLAAIKNTFPEGFA
jgi:tRNA nucleotidyltransferase (CCA-adding enzyme)